MFSSELPSYLREGDVTLQINIVRHCRQRYLEVFELQNPEIMREVKQKLLPLFISYYEKYGSIFVESYIAYYKLPPEAFSQCLWTHLHQLGNHGLAHESFASALKAWGEKYRLSPEYFYEFNTRKMTASMVIGVEYARQNWVYNCVIHSLLEYCQSGNFTTLGGGLFFGMPRKEFAINLELPEFVWQSHKQESADFVSESLEVVAKLLKEKVEKIKVEFEEEYTTPYLPHNPHKFDEHLHWLTLWQTKRMSQKAISQTVYKDSKFEGTSTVKEALKSVCKTLGVDYGKLKLPPGKRRKS